MSIVDPDEKGRTFTKTLAEGDYLGEIGLLYDTRRTMDVEAVGHCHRHEVVHRDLKPENVLYAGPEGSPDGDRLLVTDFGLAAVIAPDKNLYTLCGTPGYVSPEILRACARTVEWEHAPWEQAAWERAREHASLPNVTISGTCIRTRCVTRRRWACLKNSDCCGIMCQRLKRCLSCIAAQL